MDDVQRVRASKFLSKHLRHQPERLGLSLGPGGWVAVADLLEACSRKGFHLSRDELEEVVARNEKQRFAFDSTGLRIRANQGHSVEIDLELEPVEPPESLYHGTGVGTASIIEREGLRRMRRHHVHLSTDVETARRVGTRHGKPVVYLVRSGAMHRAGWSFRCSANGVWLVDEVPVEYLSRLAACEDGGSGAD